MENNKGYFSSLFATTTTDSTPATTNSEPLVTLDFAKEFLKVDFDDEDMLIQLLIDSSIETIENATGKTFDSSCKLAVICALKIISFNFENRNSVIDKKSTLIPNFISDDLFRLKHGSKGIKINGSN